MNAPTFPIRLNRQLSGGKEPHLLQRGEKHESHRKRRDQHTLHRKRRDQHALHR